MRPQRISNIFLALGASLLIFPCLLRTQESDTLDYSIESKRFPFIESQEYAKKLESYDLWIGVGYSTGMDRSRKFLGLKEGVLTVGGYTTQSRWIQYYLSYLYTPIQKTSDPEYSIDHGISQIEFGAEAEFYTQSKYSFLGHYFSFGIGGVFAFWDYSLSNPVNWEIIDSYDHEWGCDIHCGTGFILGALQPFNLILDVTPGIVLWLSESYQGFPQSLLPIYYYLKVRLSLNYPIASW
jgi:hypothetical protein